MRLIIAGGRQFECGEQHFAWLDALAAHVKTMGDPITDVVSGGAEGADQCGEVWAARHNIPVHIYRPRWALYGARAGPMRNQAMAENADALALFPGDRGTASMRREAYKAGLIVFEFVNWVPVGSST